MLEISVVDAETDVCPSRPDGILLLMQAVLVGSAPKNHCLMLCCVNAVFAEFRSKQAYRKVGWQHHNQAPDGQEKEELGTYKTPHISVTMTRI